MNTIVGCKESKKLKTISHWHRFGLLLTSASMALFCQNIACADPITLKGVDKPVWGSYGITVNGATTNKLSEVKLRAGVPTNVSDAINELDSAINSLVTTSDAVNKAKLERAVKAYNEAISSAQNDHTEINGISTIIFNDDATITATANTADQRLAFHADLGGNGLILNIAQGKTVTIQNNMNLPILRIDNTEYYGGALNINQQFNAFAQNGGGKIVFRNNTAIYGGAIFLLTSTASFGSGTTFIGNRSIRAGGAIYSGRDSTLIFGDNAFFYGNVSAGEVNCGGGAIYNLNGVIALGDNATFESNSASGLNASLGGAVFNSNVAIFGKNASFRNNRSAEKGGAIYNVVGTTVLGENARFEGNSANADFGGAIYNSGTIVFKNGVKFEGNNVNNGSGGAIYSGGNVTLETDSSGSATQFFGNRDASGLNSISVDSGSLAISGNGVVDMLDPMRRIIRDSVVIQDVSISQSGGGTWYLAGTNDFAPDGADKTAFSISDGQLYLYGEGEASKSGAMTSEGSIVRAGLGVIKIGGSNSSFNLGSDATLTAGGMGNAIQAAAGKITLANNATLGFNLMNYDKASSSAMMNLEAAQITVGDNLNINLTSAARLKGDYKLLTVSKSDVLVNDKITLMAAGQVVDDVDFLQDAKGRVEDKNYIVTIGGYTWNSKLINSSDGKSYAHGNFTVASGDFTIAEAFADRTDIEGATNNKGWDGKSLTKKGAGTLILDGANTYTGLTRVEAGSLIIGGDIGHNNAQIAGDVSVLEGATFGGYGTVFGDVQLASGATVSPGHSIGTLTVGSIHFGSGSTYLLEGDNNGSADKIVATKANGGTGMAVIENGARLEINGLVKGKNNEVHNYTIIDSEGGVNGQFNQVVNNLAFFDYAVSYTDNQVNLTLKRNNRDLDDVDNGGNGNGGLVSGNRNRRNVGRAVASLPDNNPIYDAVIGLTKDQVRPAYDNLSGEIYGSTRSVLMMNSHYLRDAVNRRMLSESRMPSIEPVWFASWGHGGDIDGNSNAAKVDNKGWGIALGADGEFSDNIFAGLVLGYERTEIDGKGRSSNSDIDAFHIGGYVATEIKTIKLRGGLAYSYLDSDFERNIWVNGLQGKAKSDPNGWQFQIFGEASKDFQVSDKATLSPYANIAHVWLDFDDIGEHGSAAALDVDGGTDSTTFTTLGLRAEVKLPTTILPATSNVSLYGDLGWQHAFGDTDGKTTNRFRGVGNTFSIKGIGVDEDTALIGVGFNIAINAKNTITLGYQGQIGSDISDHSANVMWKVRF